MKRIITLAMIDKLCPHRKEYNLMDREQLGFGVRVRSTGHKSFIFKRRIDGNLISQTLGEVNRIPLDHARKMASDLMHNI